MSHEPEFLSELCHYCLPNREHLWHLFSTEKCSNLKQAEDKMKWKQAKPDLAWTTTIKTELGIGNNNQ